MVSRSDRASGGDRASRTGRPAAAPPTWRGARGVGICQTVLVVSDSFGPALAAPDVAAALARGLRADGALTVDVCPLPDAHADRADRQAIRAPGAGHANAGALLDALDFDARMRASRAVVVATERLRERALAGSVTFELATRARQAGVPAYAVTAENALDRFDARMLDLQLVLQAGSARALAAAGGRLAAIV